MTTPFFNTIIRMNLTDHLNLNISLAYGWRHYQAPQAIENHSTLNDRDISNLEDTGPIMKCSWAFQIHMAAMVRT